jgi:hypothetical protein
MVCQSSLPLGPKNTDRPLPQSGVHRRCAWHAGHLVSIAFVLAASFISASQVATIRPTLRSPWNFLEYSLFGDIGDALGGCHDPRKYAASGAASRN